MKDRVARLFSGRSRVWIWWRGRIRLPQEFAVPGLGQRFLAVLKHEISECSLLSEQEGNQIRFDGLQIRREWWASSRVLATGTIRFETAAGTAFVFYEISAWPHAPVALAVAGACALWGVFIGDQAAAIAAAIAVTALGILTPLAGSILIVRRVLHRTVRRVFSRQAPRQD